MSGDLRLLILGFAWVVVLVMGSHAVMQYQTRAGTAGDPSQQLPPDLHLPHTEGAFVLVMLAHPNCPCTRASVVELERLMVRANGRLAAFVALSKPGASAQELRASPIGLRAAQIPGVTVLTDERLVSQIFAGETSGQTLLYTPQGRLVYSGGITLSRGHEGANAGADAVLARIDGTSRTFLETPIFGCPLKSPSELQLRNDPSWKRK